MGRSVDQLKRKLRQLKKLEVSSRFKDRPAPENRKLLWDVFFSTRAENDVSVKYPLSRLLKMGREDWDCLPTQASRTSRSDFGHWRNGIIPTTAGTTRSSSRWSKSTSNSRVSESEVGREVREE